MGVAARSASKQIRPAQRRTLRRATATDRLLWPLSCSRCWFVRPLAAPDCCSPRHHCSRRVSRQAIEKNPPSKNRTLQSRSCSMRCGSTGRPWWARTRSERADKSVSVWVGGAQKSAERRGKNEKGRLSKSILGLYNRVYSAHTRTHVCGPTKILQCCSRTSSW